VTGTRTRVTLKLGWTLNASINASAFDDLAGATASYDFKIEYSLDNGSTWTVMRVLNDSVSIPDGAGGSDSDGINTSGSESVDMPNPGGIDLTQIRVRDRIFTSAAVRISNNGSASSNATASVSLIRLEVDTVPVITGVSSSAVTHNSATISWTTNEPADSQVEYGTITAYGQSTTLNPALVTSHSQGLSGLTPGTLYHYRVKSRDATGNLAVSGDFSFTTSTLDTTPPVISDVAAGGITATTATITWTTNENSDSQVEYGPTTAYGQSTALNPALLTAHSQGLSGLNSGTLYHYRVKSRDAAGNLAVSGDFTFTTPDITPPVISNVAAVGITTDTATITWTTNENSDSQVEYGTTTAYGQSTTLNPTLMTAHSQGLSGLNPGTLYHYRVKSKDAAGNLAVSGDFTFTTAQNVSGGIKWLVTDHLGSTRMVIDETGSLAGIKRHDFAPFSEKLSAGVGIRSAALGYGDDGIRQKFDGYEKDSETELYFAQARYYSSIQGRFTSPDAPFADQFEGEPQSWNLYAFARNNPCANTDPTGRNTCYYTKDKDGNNDKLIGCDKQKGIQLVTKGGKGALYYTPKDGPRQVYDLDNINAVSHNSTGTDQPGEFIFEMSRRAPALQTITAGAGIYAGAVIALPTIGLTAGGAIGGTSSGGIISVSPWALANIGRFATQIYSRAAIIARGTSGLEAARRALSNALWEVDKFRQVHNIGTPANPIWGALESRIGLADIGGNIYIVQTNASGQIVNVYGLLSALLK
jgi:RHS repeat-associated protein